MVCLKASEISEKVFVLHPKEEFKSVSTAVCLLSHSMPLVRANTSSRTLQDIVHEGDSPGADNQGDCSAMYTSAMTFK